MLELLALEQQLFVAGGAGIHIYGGVDAAFGGAAIQAKLHVAGAFELFKYHLVHLGARLHQCGAEDRERAAFFHIAGCAEELLGGV